MHVREKVGLRASIPFASLRRCSPKLLNIYSGTLRGPPTVPRLSLPERELNIPSSLVPSFELNVVSQLPRSYPIWDASPTMGIY